MNCLESFSPPPRLSPEHAKQARHFAKQIGSQYKVLAIHGNSTPDKTWQQTRMADFVNAFLRRHDDFIVLGLGTDSSFADSVLNKVRVLSCHELPLPVQLNLLRRADVFVGIDSSMLHAADHYQIPSVALFGPTSNKDHNFSFAGHRYVEGHGTMDRIGTVAILSALEELMAKQEIVPNSGKYIPVLGNRELTEVESRLLRSAKHPVVFCVNGIGDHLIVLPAYRALCQLFPGKLTVVCLDSYAKFIWEELPAARFVPFYYSDTEKYLFDPEDLAAKIGKCDLFISIFTCQSESLTKLMELLKPKRSIGFYSDNYTYTVESDWRDTNYVDQSFYAAQIIDPSLELQRFSQLPKLGSQPAKVARQIRDFIGSNYKVLAFHADSKPFKTWPSDRAAAFVDAFLNEHKDFVVVALGSDNSFVDFVSQKSRVIKCQQISLSVQFELLKKADAFVGVDSCMLHAADLYRLPSIALYAQSNSKMWGFRFAPHQYIQGNDSMENIDPEDVLKATEKMLVEQQIISAPERSLRDKTVNKSINKSNIILKNAKNPVVFVVPGIGDHLMVLPAMRALCKAFPKNLTVVCTLPNASFLFEELPIAKFVYFRYYDPSGLFDAEELAQKIGACDLFISIFPLHTESDAKLISLLKPKESIGFFYGHHKHTVAKNWRELNYIDTAFSMAKMIDPSVELEQFAYPPNMGRQASKTARQMREFIGSTSKVLAVHTDASLSTKSWPNKLAATFLDDFLKTHHDFVAIVLGKDNSFVDSVSTSSRVLRCHQISLPVQLELLKQANAFVGVDSCMLHAADLYKLPSVGLFGPSDRQRYGFRMAPHRYVSNHGSMEGIDPSEVLSALEEIIAGQETAQSTNLQTSGSL